MNDVPLHYLKPNSLVKFRCMIQDMFDPEFYMNIYETVDTQTKSRVSTAIVDIFLHLILIAVFLCFSLFLPTLCWNS